jgi:hypothetical protein
MPVLVFSSEIAKQMPVLVFFPAKGDDEFGDSKTPYICEQEPIR